MMEIRKRAICLEHNSEMMKKLMEAEATPVENVSLRKFIDINFQAFTDSRKTTREIYEFLKQENVDVGSFQVFKTLYSRVKRSRAQKSATLMKTPISGALSDSSKEQESLESKVTPIPQRAEKEGGAGEARRSKYNPALPPVYLPGGVEAIIDPETGAKRFEIQ
jgi:hypothetical protein